MTDVMRVAMKKSKFILIGINVGVFILFVGMFVWQKIDIQVATALSAICVWIINHSSKGHAEEWLVDSAIEQLREDISDKSQLQYRLDGHEVLIALSFEIGRALVKGMTSEELMACLQKEHHVRSENRVLGQLGGISKNGIATIKTDDFGMKLRPQEIILTFTDGKLEKWCLREMIEK